MAKKENTQSCFQRGLISLLILALLDQEDMYGYQIVQEITERSGGTLYRRNQNNRKINLKSHI